MGSETEPAKALLPYLQRADELQKHEPLVAYYCRLYAMERGLKIPTKDRTKTTNSILVSLMNQLEKDKKTIKFTAEDNLYLEGFAANVFEKADKQDRAGRADLNTAKTFYAASIFFEILNQFGEMQPDIEQKQKYAAWKAADIRKALKEGRKPEPGPPGGGSENLPFPQTTATNDLDETQKRESSPPKSPGARSPHHDDTINPLPPPTNSPPRSSSYPQHYQDIPYSPDLRSIHQSISPPSNYLPPEQHPQDYPSSYGYDRSSENYPQQYPTQQTYPHFQTYPSFNDSTLPAAPTIRPSYYHGSDSAQPYNPPPSSPPVQTLHSDALQRNGSGPKAAPASASYVYDSDYEPSVERIAEAHKAARFAVGALAFDDVPVAVDFLRRSLELLTNPSAETR
ncbi:hydroxyproline-rich glycoprotein family protein [Wolffia australiana]